MNRKAKEEKQRLDREAHRQLDQICDLVRAIAVVNTLTTDAQTLSTIEVLRRAALHRLGQIRRAFRDD
jgi:hypothetical protein